MSGTFDKRPELMILIAVLVAIVLGIIATVGSCTALVAASANSVDSRFGTLDGNGLAERDDIDELLEELMGGGSGNSGDSDASGGMNGLTETYTESDVPDEMDIDVPELTSDLEACINRDIQYELSLDDADVKITELTKDEVAKPELKNGRVLCQVSGKATIENAEGETGTIDYTSYYYADDPTADKITWYIYAYDLGSYDLLPEGLEKVAGDPVGLRDLLQADESSYQHELSKDHAKDAEDA